jgi:hypothetical protein
MLASEPAERKSVWTNRMMQLEVRLTDHTIGCPNLQASTSGRLRVWLLLLDRLCAPQKIPASFAMIAA